jgi:hypothetical protein
MYTKYDAMVMLPIFAGLILITLLTWWLLRKKTGWVRQIPFIVIVVIILALEIAKQSFALAQISEHGFNYWYLPVHISSAPLYFAPFAAFSKPNSNFGRVAFMLAIAFALFISFGTVLFPEMVFGNIIGRLINNSAGLETFAFCHSIIYHSLVLLFVMLAIALRPCKPKWRDIGYITLAFALFLIVTATMANVMHHVVGVGIRRSDYGNFLTLPIGEFSIVVRALLVWMIYVSSSALLATAMVGTTKLTSKLINRKKL